MPLSVFTPAQEHETEQKDRRDSQKYEDNDERAVRAAGDITPDIGRCGTRSALGARGPTTAASHGLPPGADDVLDATSSAEVLGKGVMSDGDKTTFMTYFTPEAAYELAERYTLDAINDIKDFDSSERLCSLALYLLERKN